MFGHNDVATRYSLLLEVGDLREEVRTTASNALYSSLRKANTAEVGYKMRKEELGTRGPLLPDFLDMMTFLMVKCGIRIKWDKDQDLILIFLE